jgi:hypothetical protein
VIGISYRGAVTQKQAAQLNAAVSSAYSGKKGDYAVNVTIISATEAKFGNYVTVVNGTSGSETSGVGGRETTLYTGDPAGASMSEVMVHEAGHLMGARDQYYPSTGKPVEGSEGNVMATAKGGKVEAKNITEIIKANPPPPPPPEQKKN